jgi:hypothetical protein
MFTPTRTRVEEHTPPELNEAIRRRTEENVARYAAAGPREIDRRLAELDREWDVERVLEGNFAAVVLSGIALGSAVDRKWYLLPAVAAGFMVQHVLQGWCPPVPLLRRMGVRTMDEIQRERFALKALRGDFDDLPAATDRPAAVEGIIEAVSG